MEFRLHRIALSLLPWLAAALSAAEPLPPAPPMTPAGLPPLGVMRRMYLQDSRPYEVGVGALPTTILLPDVIEAFEASNITTVPNTVAPVYLQHRDGTRYFSVKALVPGTADLNVILKNSLYSFRFFYTDNPVRTLTIEPPPAAPVSGPGAASGGPPLRITARRLYDILQDAKTYFLLRDQHPELPRGIAVVSPGKVIDYPGYRVVVDQVFRFDRDDTLVIRAVFLNDDPLPRHYRAADVGLRIGRNLYWPSFAQLPGLIPGRVPAEIAWELSPDVTTLMITNPDGQSADLTQRVTALLLGPGCYTLVAAGAHGRTDTVSFEVHYPASTPDASPVLVSKGPHSFGVRKLTLRPPEAGQNFGYVCYTGTADGQRAELSLENDFSLVVPATLSP